MSNAYFIEIVNHNGDVQTRHQFSSLPICIGRAYHNEIILDDPHTAAEHAIIETNEDGVLIIRNIDSHNGIRLNDKRAQHFAIDGDAIFRLGHTQLRVRTRDYIVSSEIADSINHHWEGWPLALIALFIISALGLSNTWLGDIEEGKSSAYIMSICVWLGYSAIWTGIWALANRVFGGGAHFSRHLFTLSGGLAVLYLWGYASTVLAFGFSWEVFTRYSSHIEIAILAATIYFHLRQVTPRRRKRLQIICASLALFGSGLMLMKNHQNTNQYADELYMHEIYPPALRISRNHSLSDFDKDVSQLKTQIDKERENTLKEKQNEK